MAEKQACCQRILAGSAGAVANAVWYATGVRVQRFPIRIDDLVMAR
jgi:xanthine dehydrogenase YagR molybdenum-binding subunit